MLGSKATSLETLVRDELLVSVQPRLNSLPKGIQNILEKGMTPNDAPAVKPGDFGVSNDKAGAA